MSSAITLDNLLAYVLQSSAVIAAALAALWVLRIDAPSVRYFALRITLAAALVLPLLQPRINLASDTPIASTSTVNSVPRLEGARAPTPRRFSLDTASIAGGRSAAVVGGVLAAGVLARLLWLALGLWRLQHLRRLGETTVGEEYADLQTTIGTRAELRYVVGLGQPLTFGVRHPVVLLPEALRGMGETIRCAVVAHELWHVRRRDWLFMIGEEAVRAAFWFHPAMWLLLSQIQVAREETVDELAVLATGSRRGYLDALLAFADARPLFGTAAFGRRRHLIHRVLIISKEKVMSSRRVVASCAAVVIAAVAGAFGGAAAFPLVAQQSVPRDPPPPSPATAEQVSFVAASEAELQAAIAKDPKHAGPYYALARHYVKTGEFERAVATLDSLVLADPSSPQHPHTLAVFYWEKAYRDSTLSREQKTTYLLAGIAASDRALAIDSDYPEAVTYKNILLRTLATYTTDASEQRRLMQEADALRARAIELMKQRGATAGRSTSPRDTMPPPPPPPPPFGMVDGMMPIHVGGNIPPPTKIKDVRPEYPIEARTNGISGVVIIEAVIDTIGHVREARVLRSVPPLDAAALGAVRQWVFTPTLLNNAPVPVIMTVTVNFSLQ